MDSFCASGLTLILLVHDVDQGSQTQSVSWAE